MKRIDYDDGSISFRLNKEIIWCMASILFGIALIAAAIILHLKTDMGLKMILTCGVVGGTLIVLGIFLLFGTTFFILKNDSVVKNIFLGPIKIVNIEKQFSEITDIEIDGKLIKIHHVAESDDNVPNFLGISGFDNQKQVSEIYELLNNYIHTTS